jgi:hypothetical protein
VLDGWSDPDSRWRRALAKELPEATGFTPEVVSEGLRIGLAEWTGEALRELVTAELGPQALHVPSARSIATGFDTTAVILAGAIPMPTLIALIAPLALRSPVIAKVGARDRVTARHVAQSLEEVDELLGRCLDVIDFPGDDGDCVDALLAAGCVVATGSDATIAAVRSRLPATARMIGYGHRLSVAAVGADSIHGDALRDAAERLALDVVLWDQLGCLSPIAAFVIDASGQAARRFAAQLAEALEELSVRLPRGSVDTTAAAQIAQERSEAEIRAAAGAAVEVHTGRQNAWTVIAEPSPEIRPAPLHRFIRVVAVTDHVELFAAVARFGPHLAAVGVVGFGRETQNVAQHFTTLGASRICPLGRMQAPPFGWRHDNQGVLAPLARFADIESLG